MIRHPIYTSREINVAAEPTVEDAHDALYDALGPVQDALDLHQTTLSAAEQARIIREAFRHFPAMLDELDRMGRVEARP